MSSFKKWAIPWWAWAAWALTILVEFALYPHLPGRVATHFDAAGQPNGYSSRFYAVLFGPAFMLVLMVLWQFIWKIDPKKWNYELFWPTYRYLGGVVIVFIGLVQLWMLANASGLSWATPAKVLPTIVGVLLMLLANVLPRIQQNWLLLGIRTPWTLSSEESWRKTHRLAGHLGIPAGLVMIVLPWCVPSTFLPWVILGPVVTWGAVAVVASYFYARQT